VQNPPAAPPPLLRRWPLVLLLGVAGVLTCAAICGVVALIAILPSTVPTQPVTLIVGGTGYQMEARGATVADALEEFKVLLQPGDSVIPAPDTPLNANLVIRVERARPVTITIDGQAQTIQTTFSSPLDILRNSGIEVAAADRLSIDGTQTDAEALLMWPVPVSQITIQRAMTISILDGSQQQVIETTAATVGEAVYEAGVTLYLADTIQPDVNSPLSDNLTITVQRSAPVSITADGVTLETRTQGSTVADALASAGVLLMGLDYSVPGEDVPLGGGMTIRVIRVTEEIDIQQEVIPFETVYQGDSTMELDTQRVVSEGQNGIRQTNIRVRYENGVEISRETETEAATTTEPINRVIAYGTNIVFRTVDTPEGPREYWRVIRMYATSYHPAALGGDNVTATGRILTRGIVGIDPRIIPYDSTLYVPNYGVGVAADTGGPRRIKLWIDLGYDDENWVSWSRYVDVYLLTPVPPEFPYILPQ
jgi:resuscitation-promoting factor RpfB